MQADLITTALSGAALGFWAGIAPGPLLALVITETMCHGARSGVRVALAPLVTDPPIIALAALAVAGLARLSGVLGVVSLAGAALLAWLAWETFFARPPEVDAAPRRCRSLRKGIATNLLNPHPYLFWLTVGAPLLVTAHRESGWAGPALYLLAFYAMIVGAKMAVALATARSRAFLVGPGYRWVMRLMGAVLAWFCLDFALQGLALLGIRG